jgi:hypothetical protein
VKIRHLAVTLTLLFLARPAFPWGANGHRVVGRIAEHHLSEAAARGVACILGPESLAQAATWPDEIRSDPPGTAPSPGTSSIWTTARPTIPPSIRRGMW